MVVERCDVDISQRIESEAFAVHEKKIEAIAARYVYTHPILRLHMTSFRVIGRHLG